MNIRIMIIRLKSSCKEIPNPKSITLMTHIIIIIIPIPTIIYLLFVFVQFSDETAKMAAPPTIPDNTAKISINI